MSSRFRCSAVRLGTSLVVALLAGCDGGGGVIRLHFGSNGVSDCSRFEIEMDLDYAGAIFARGNVVDESCDLDGSLARSGCEVSYDETEYGYLRATVSGCSIPAVTRLLECAFDDVDAALLQERVFGQCTCVAEGCFPGVAICVSEDPDPTSCENCRNGIDDDDNGRADCEDVNCQNLPECEPFSTTTMETTSTTSSTTTTSNTFSTMTMPPPPSTTLPFDETCKVRFRMTDDLTAGSLQWDTHYQGASGYFEGEGGGVECEGLVDGSLSAFNDNDATKRLDSGVISLDGFTGPVDVAECTFRGMHEPDPGDFTIFVVESSTPDLTPIVPFPDVIVGSVDCESSPPTTHGWPGSTIDHWPPTTHDTIPYTSFDVVFRLDSSGSPLGALQFSVEYSAASGEFQGSGASVACSNLVAGALIASNDDDAGRKLTIGQIALGSFSAPADLVRCRFVGDSPSIEDLPITIDDATDIDGEPVTATISATVGPAQ